MHRQRAFHCSPLPLFTYRHFSTSRPWVPLHAIHHLRGNNHRLSSSVTLRDHHSLRRKDLGIWDFDTQISTSHHDSIRFLQNRIKVIQTFLTFNLTNNQRPQGFGTIDSIRQVRDASIQKCHHRAHIRSGSDKRGCHKIRTHLTGPFQVSLVLVRQGWQIQLAARQIDSLVFLNRASIQGLANNIFHCRIHLNNFESNETIIQQYFSTNRNRLGNGHVVHMNTHGSFRFFGNIVRRKSHNSTHLNIHNLSIPRQRSRSNLGSLGIHHDGSQIQRQFTRFHQRCRRTHGQNSMFPMRLTHQPIEFFGVTVIGTRVGKVETRHVHAVMDQQTNRFGLVRGRSQCAHNLGVGASHGKLVQA
jgi:hypothetical protein